MRKAITVCSVMAFLFGAAAWSAEPAAQEDSSDSPQWGYVAPCANWHVAKKVLASGGTSRLVAAYAEEGNELAWLRILQREKNFTLEVGNPKVRRRNIDPQLAKRISARLKNDLARNAFMFPSDEIQMDGIWYAYTVDGESCATMGMIHRNATAVAWSRVFSWLFDDAANSEARAQFWLNQLERTPSTLPTSLADLVSGHDVIGAASSWQHPGIEPLSIFSHRARADDDKIEIIGELRNNMDTALAYSDVYATFYDASGAVLVEDDALVDLSLLPPGTRSPFSASVPAKDVAAYTLRVEFGREAKTNPPNLRITEHHSRDDEEDLIVSGSVLNEGKTDQTFVEVYVNLYDEAGRLLLSDSDFVVVKDPLPAGASGTFEVRNERPPGYHHYEVLIDPDYRETRD